MIRSIINRVRLFVYDWSWEIVILTLLGGILALIVGCVPRPVVPPVLQSSPTASPVRDVAIERSRVESADAEVARLTGELRTAKDLADVARTNEREARLAGVRTLVTWLTAICVLVGILSVGASLFLRMPTMLLLTAACGAMVIAAQASNLLLDHPVAAGIGLAAIVGGVVAALWLKQHHTERGLIGAIQVAESLKPDAGTESEVDRLERRLMQTKLVQSAGAGAFAAIESARTKLFGNGTNA